MFGLPENVYNEIIKIVRKFGEYKFKIFGSRARGDFKYNSDIDLAIFENVSNEDKFKIENEIDLVDMPYMVDFVFVDRDTKKELLESIEKEGVDFG